METIEETSESFDFKLDSVLSGGDDLSWERIDSDECDTNMLITKIKKLKNLLGEEQSNRFD